MEGYLSAQRTDVQGDSKFHSLDVMGNHTPTHDPHSRTIHTNYTSLMRYSSVLVKLDN